jgi:paraquat-inducible protein A
MATLIQIEGLAVIEVGFGAIAFGSVVVLTMLSAMSFDPRLMWDHLQTDPVDSHKLAVEISGDNE